MEEESQEKAGLFASISSNKSGSQDTMDTIDLSTVNLDWEQVGLPDFDFQERSKILFVSCVDKEVTMAMAEPDDFIQEEVAMLLPGGYVLEVVLANPEQIEEYREKQKKLGLLQKEPVQPAKSSEPPKGLFAGDPIIEQ